jgi:4-amino-4-deoxy-L-arabinose transferase-like glycosyltransferase
MPRRTLAFLAVGAVVVRLAYLVAFARDYTPRSDADHYQAIASAFANGDGIAAPFPFTYLHPTAFRPPLYPALLGAVYWITGVHVGVGQLFNVALGATVVVLAAMLGAQIAGYRAGVAAGIAVGVYPPILANDVVLLSEPLSLALLLAMILLLVRNRPTWAGAACGLLVLTRPSAQLFVIVVAAWLIWRAGWRAAVRFGVVSIAVVARGWCATGLSSGRPWWSRPTASTSSRSTPRKQRRAAGSRTQSLTTDLLASTRTTAMKSSSTTPIVSTRSTPSETTGRFRRACSATTW